MAVQLLASALPFTFREDVVKHAVRTLLLTIVAGVLTTTASVAAPVDQEMSGIEIVMAEYTFSPDQPIVSAGTFRIRITNSGIRRHNVVVLVEGAEQASPEVRPGDVVEWDVQIERPGRYQFWCGEYRHLEKGMVGTLLVE